MVLLMIGTNKGPMRIINWHLLRNEPMEGVSHCDRVVQEAVVDLPHKSLPSYIAHFTMAKKQEPAQPPPQAPGPRVNPESTQKMETIKKQIDDTTAVMSHNIESAMERGERLDDVATKTSNLAEKSKQFQKHTKQVEKNLWYKNMKMTLVLIFIVLIIIGLVGLGIWFQVR